MTHTWTETKTLHAEADRGAVATVVGHTGKVATPASRRGTFLGTFVLFTVFVLPATSSCHVMHDDGAQFSKARPIPNYSLRHCA